MALNQSNTYNLSVTYGRYYTNKNYDGTTSTDYSLKWCWKATATIISPATNTLIVPTYWNNDSPTYGSITTITAIAMYWSYMSTYISELTSFWGESQENIEANSGEPSQEPTQEPSQEEEPNENV